MDRRSILRRAMMLAVPMMIQNGITNSVGLVDHIMVGSLGTEAMNAVSIVGQLLFVLYLALYGGISGPGIYTAQFYGSGNTEGVRTCVRMKLWICLLCTAVGSAVLFFGDSFFINLYLHGESAQIDPALTVAYSKEYLHIMLAGLPAMAAAQIYSSTLRETGESFIPMTAGIVSVSADVVFNYLLIYGKLGFPQLGVAGAALATVISRYVELIMLVVWSYIKRSDHPFIIGLWRKLTIPKDISGVMIKKSIPVFLNEFLWAASLTVLTQCYSTKGLEVVAGLNISNVLCNLFNVIFVALGMAVGILIGQMLGAGEFEKAQKSSFTLTWFTGAISTGLMIVLIALSGVFPTFYDTTDAVMDFASRFIIVTALFFPLQGVLNAVYFTLRSGGKTLVTLGFDSVFSWVVSVPIAFLLCFLTDLPIIAIYAIVQAADMIKAVIGIIMIKKGIWISNLISGFDKQDT